MNSIVIITAVVVAAGAVASSLGSRLEYQHVTSEVKASGLCYQVNKLICSKDCKQLFLCVRDEMIWTPILIANCTTGMYCDGNQGICRTSLSTCSPTTPPVFQLHCSATGHFPDPYDCTVFHECGAIGALSKVSACPAGWSYNALTTDCDHRLSSGVCFPAGVIPPCSSAGQSGPVPENTNIYYVCLQTSTGLFHELFKCAHGGHYLNGQCTEMENTTHEPTTTTPGTTEPDTTTEETTAAPVETTAAPVETTVAPVETTVAPEETTVAPVETTVAPEETTVAPEETTVAPEETTVAPPPPPY